MTLLRRRCCKVREVVHEVPKCDGYEYRKYRREVIRGEARALCGTTRPLVSVADQETVSVWHMATYNTAPLMGFDIFRIH